LPITFVIRFVHTCFLPDLLKRDILSSGGDLTAMRAHLHQVESVTHDVKLKHLMRLAQTDPTLASLLGFESAEGTPAPPIISDAGAATMAMDPLDVQDRLDGYVDAHFTPPKDAPPRPPTAFAAHNQAIDDMNIKLRQALQSDMKEEWEAAHSLDVHLMIDNDAIQLCSWDDYLADLKKYGSDRVALRHIVYACKVKVNAKGEITKVKVRGCVADATVEVAAQRIVLERFLILILPLLLLLLDDSLLRSWPCIPTLPVLRMMCVALTTVASRSLQKKVVVVCIASSHPRWRSMVSLSTPTASAISFASLATSLVVKKLARSGVMSTQPS